MVDGSSTEISGCHEAVETRTRRVRYMFSNNASFQPHREPSPCPFAFSLWSNHIRCKGEDLMDCQRTSRNFLTFFAASYANFVRVIGWCLAVWSVVGILNVRKTGWKANMYSALPLIARVGIRQPEREI